MLFIIRLLAIVSIVLNPALTSPAFAGGEGTGSGGSSTGGSGAGARLSSATTNQVVKTITNGVRRCQRVEKIYRFDCYRQTYRLAISFMNGNPAYARAQKALIDVEKSLERIVKRNADTKVRKKRQGLQTYQAIKPTAVPRATAELDRALGKAETLLLRSPERGGNHYARIAEAVQSNKVLLRSRLYPDQQDLFDTAFA